MGVLKKTIGKFIAKIRPIKKNRIVFTSFDGHYSDSPRRISEALYTLDNSIEQVWLVKNEYMNLLPPYVKGVNIDKEKVKYRSSARALVDNVYANKSVELKKNTFKARLAFKFTKWMKNKRGQKVFSTWHGTPIKRMARDQIGYEIYNFACPNTTLILGNEFTRKVMENITFGKVKTELIGSPRNDILFNTNQEFLSELKQRLGFDVDKKVAMFAPTFRADGDDGLTSKNVRRSGIEQIESMDFDLLFKTLSEKFGGDWVIVCRFHYHVQKMVDWENLNKRYGGRIVNGNKNDDMAEYLAVTDFLISDASSSVFDYMLTGKPCMLYFPDMEHYVGAERGLYVPIDQLPFDCAVTFDDFIDNLKNFNEQEYSKKIDAIIKQFGFVDSANSAKKIAEYILAEAFRR